MKKYFIYPYNYKLLDKKVLLINECSEFIFLSEKEFFQLKTDPCSILPEIIELLKQKFFIVEDNQSEIADQIIEVKKRTKQSYLINDVLLLMVVPTIGCNCNCIYCQVSSKIQKNEKNDMSFSTIIHFCDFVFALPHKEIKIEFQGGEPLLAFDTIKFIISRVTFLNKHYHKNITFVVCTNLLNITKQQINFFSKYSVEISTSIDGPQLIHDKNRPSIYYNSTFNKTVENILLLRKRKVFPSALVTITINNISMMKDIVDTYIKLGFTGIFIRPLNNYGLAYKNKEIKYSLNNFFEEYKKTVNYIIELNVKGIHIQEEWFNIILRKIFSPFNDGFVDMQNPCALGDRKSVV